MSASSRHLAAMTYNLPMVVMNFCFTGLISFSLTWIGHVKEYPTMHYFGNPKHSQSMIVLYDFVNTPYCSNSINLRLYCFWNSLSYNISALWVNRFTVLIVWVQLLLWDTLYVNIHKIFFYLYIAEKLVQSTSFLQRSWEVHFVSGHIFSEMPEFIPKDGKDQFSEDLSEMQGKNPINSYVIS